MNDSVIRMKIVTRTWGDRVLTIGKAFLNNKGVDGEFWSLPIANAQGRYLFSIVGEDGIGPAASGLRLKVLLPRAFNGRDGEDRTQWSFIGGATMGEAIQGELYVLPLPNRAEGVVRFVMREDDGKPAQPQGGFQAPRGQSAGKFSQQARQPPQERPQAPQGGGLRPQHRDGLGGPQGAVYGGAAGQQSFEGREVGDGIEDDIPF